MRHVVRSLPLQVLILSGLACQTTAPRESSSEGIAGTHDVSGSAAGTQAAVQPLAVSKAPLKNAEPRTVPGRNPNREVPPEVRGFIVEFQEPPLAASIASVPKGTAKTLSASELSAARSRGPAPTLTSSSTRETTGAAAPVRSTGF